MSIKLELPKLTELKPRIIVFGVGGAGGNAVNNMISSGLAGVEFVVANTDAQALVTSSAEHRVQLGVNLTEGLGAGSKPEIGEAAAEEALDELQAQMAGAHMVFVACGMGGGTGTGAASVIARIAKEQNILTVGVVTKPFLFEGTRRMRIAEAGIDELQKYVDTLIVIPNQNLFRIASEKTTFAEAFILADQVLYSGIACIVDLIVKEGLINLDFADVRVIMSGMGSAMMGTGEGEGERRAIIAAEEAITNPLLDELTLSGAKGLLLSIVGGKDLTLYEVDEAASRVRQEVDRDANIIVGASFDETLGERVRVSIVASGMDGQSNLGSDDSYPRAREQVPSGNNQSNAPAVDEAAHDILDDVDSQSSTFTPGEPHSASKVDPIGVNGTGSEANSAADGLDRDASLVAATKEATAQADNGSSTAWHAPGDVEIEETAPQLTAAAAPSHGPGAHGSGAHGPGAPSQSQHPAGPFPPAQPLQAQQSGSRFSSDQSHGGPAQMPSQFAPQAPKPVAASGTRMPPVEDFPLVGQREYRAKTQPPALPGRSGTQPPPSNSNAGQAQPRKKGFFERLTGRRSQAGDATQSAPHPQSSPQDSLQGPPAVRNTRNPRQSDGNLPVGPRRSGKDTVSPQADDVSGDVDLPVFFDRGRR